MNPKQRILLIVALHVAGLMCLFPPWSHQFLYHIPGLPADRRQSFIGFHFVTYEPYKPRIDQYSDIFELDDYEFEESPYSTGIDTTQLVFQLIMLGLLTLCGYIKLITLEPESDDRRA